MADNLRQRRGKRSSDGGGAASAGAEASSSATANGNGQPQQQLTPIEQLKGARAKLVVSRDRTADLHAVWKGQLFLLSLLVLIVAMHQLQTSVSSCILEVKGSGGDGGSVTGAEVARLALGDSCCEVLGVVVASLLAYFLALAKMSGTSPVELDRWPYILSGALVPVTLGLYFHSGQAGCLPEKGGEAFEGSEGTASNERHQFPVVAIWHTIVTAAFWFMKNGRQQCEEHVQLVDDSIRDFERMDEKLKLKEQLKRKTRKK